MAFTQHIKFQSTIPFSWAWTGVFYIPNSSLGFKVFSQGQQICNQSFHQGTIRNTKATNSKLGLGPRCSAVKDYSGSHQCEFLLRKKCEDQKLSNSLEFFFYETSQQSRSLKLPLPFYKEFLGSGFTFFGYFSWLPSLCPNEEKSVLRQIGH